MSIPEPNLQALIALLSETQAEIVEAVRLKLIQLGREAIPALQAAASSHADPKVRVEASVVLERIRLEDVGRLWGQVAQTADPGVDLEKGVFLLAKVPYPELNPTLYSEQLDDFANRLRPRLKAGLSPKQQLGVLNRFLFREQRFQGNWNDYFDPENSFLNRVMDRKLGIPISLSVLYLLLAQRLELNVLGAGIPGHFMVKYQDPSMEIFVDPFNEGRFLSRGECIQFIIEAGYPYQAAFLEGVGSREILARMLRNLILIYVDRHEETLERTFSRFLDLLYGPEGPDVLGGPR